MKNKILMSSLAGLILLTSGLIYNQVHASNQVSEYIHKNINNRAKQLSDITEQEEQFIFSKINNNIKECYSIVKENYPINIESPSLRVYVDSITKNEEKEIRLSRLSERYNDDYSKVVAFNGNRLFSPTMSNFEIYCFPKNIGILDRRMDDLKFVSGEELKLYLEDWRDWINWKSLSFEYDVKSWDDFTEEYQQRLNRIELSNLFEVQEWIKTKEGVSAKILKMKGDEDFRIGISFKTRGNKPEIIWLNDIDKKHIDLKELNERIPSTHVSFSYKEKGAALRFTKNWMNENQYNYFDSIIEFLEFKVPNNYKDNIKFIMHGDQISIWANNFDIDENDDFRAYSPCKGHENPEFCKWALADDVKEFELFRIKKNSVWNPHDGDIEYD